MKTIERREHVKNINKMQMIIAISVCVGIIGQSVRQNIDLIGGQQEMSDYIIKTEATYIIRYLSTIIKILKHVKRGLLKTKSGNGLKKVR